MNKTSNVRTPTNQRICKVESVRTLIFEYLERVRTQGADNDVAVTSNE